MRLYMHLCILIAPFTFSSRQEALGDRKLLVKNHCSTKQHAQGFKDPRRRMWLKLRGPDLVSVKTNIHAGVCIDVYIYMCIYICIYI